MLLYSIWDMVTSLATVSIFSLSSSYCSALRGLFSCLSRFHYHLTNRLPVLYSHVLNRLPVYHSDLLNRLPVLYSHLSNRLPVYHSDLLNRLPVLYSHLSNRLPVYHSHLLNRLPVLYSHLFNGVAGKRLFALFKTKPLEDVILVSLKMILTIFLCSHQFYGKRNRYSITSVHFRFLNLTKLSYPLASQARSQNCEQRLLALSCLSVRPSVNTHETTRLPLDGFSWKLRFEDFSKICQENPSIIKI
jgi:hypothetical protein